MTEDGKKTKKRKSYHSTDDNDEITRISPATKPSLSDMLTYGVIKYPNFMLKEFSAMLIALQSNKSVNTINITDIPMRLYIDELMRYLPVTLSPQEGWCLSSDDSSQKNINSFILLELLNNQTIVQPYQLSPNQLISSRFIPMKFLRIFELFPDLIDDIETILTTILNGGAVDIDSIENEEVVEVLRAFLSSLDLVNSNDTDIDMGSESSSKTDGIDTGYSLPEDDPSCRRSQASILYYLTVLKSFKKFEKYFRAVHLSNNHKYPQFHDTSKCVDVRFDAQDNGYDATSSVNAIQFRKVCTLDSSELHSNEDHKVSYSTPGPRILGPSLPSTIQLQLASRLVQSQSDIMDDGDHDESIGPVVPRSDPSNKFHSYSREPWSDLPLGYVGVDASTLYQEDAPADRKDDADMSNETRDGRLVREDWMLTPGERDPFSGLNDNTNRKFQTGKSAKKLAEALTKHHEEYEASNISTDSEMVSRGPSLMEQHMAVVNAKKATTPMERLPFDREREMSSHKMLGNKEVEKLIENARKLDNGFSKGMVQRSSI